MKILIVGASKGLGRAFAQGLCQPGDCVIGVSRHRPEQFKVPDGVELQWIEADLSKPDAAAQVAQAAPFALDVLICNLGVWEDTAFTDDYAFLDQSDATLAAMVGTNITSTLLLLKHLVPRVLRSTHPRVILTGSTSGLRRSGRPEVAFGASKFSLNGMADALRESFRDQKLAVTTLQLGYLNTDDELAVPAERAAARGNGELIPVHDVVAMVRALLQLSTASFVRELVMPAIRDDRF